jgi:hypothetical protein
MLFVDRLLHFPSLVPVEVLWWCLPCCRGEILDARVAASEGGLRGCSTASDATVVMALLFVHGDGKERVAGDPGVGDVLAKASPRPC